MDDNEVAVVDEDVNEGELTPSSDSQPGEESSQGQAETPGVEDSSAEEVEESKPFHKEPAFQERIREVEQKYGTKASNWDTINQIAAEDPEFALTIISKMESAGAVPKGTLERAQQQLKVATPKKDDTAEKVEKVDKIQEALESNPDIQYARQIREREEQKAKEEDRQLEEFLQNFEKERPDIAKQADPLITRRAINLEAQRIMASNKDIPLEKAMDQAYRWVVKREEVLEEYKEKGQIEGLVRNIQEDRVISSGGGGASGVKLRKLSPDEQSARDLMGMSNEEYLKYLDDPNSGVVDD